jgi:AGZA family xanthine/uracil permease-like MFS transporter
MNRATWMPRWGDVNGLLGLLLDNVAALVLLYVLLAAPGYPADRFRTEFVLAWLIPGTVFGVLVGGLLYAWQARRLAARTGRADVTAMPVGLDTPTVFAMALFVLVPALAEGRERFADRPGLDEQELHHLASMYAWHVGAAVLVLLGLFKLALAPLGGAVRRWLPRAALLGSLAAIALALIAFIPMARHVAPAPVVGLPVLAILLVALLARRGQPDGVPATLLALGVGLALVLVSILLGGWSFVPLSGVSNLKPEAAARAIPAEVWNADWWGPVWLAALAKLPVALPFALFTLVGGVECAESAAAEGDEYDTGGVLMAQGVASAVGGLMGGVVQTTPYFGHPAYKRMGAGWSYVVLGTLTLALIGYFGWFARAFEYIPGAAVFPVIIYIGLRTIGHAFESVPRRDYAAVALAAVPVLAYLIVVTAGEVFRGRSPTPNGVVLLQALRCLGNGFILTSLLWATALVALLDGKPLRAVVVLLIAAGCSLFGLMHSPLPGSPLAWPHEVWQELVQPGDVRGAHPDLRYQSPFHWAAAYVLAALVVLIDARLPRKVGRKEAAAPATAPDPSPALAAAAPAAADQSGAAPGV